MFAAIWNMFDFLSIQPKFYFKSKERYKTNLGTILGFSAFCGIASFSLYFLYSFLAYKEVNIIYYEDTSSSSLFFDLNDKPFFFQLIDSNKQIVSPRIATVIPFQAIIITNLTMKKLETEQCSKAKHIQSQEQLHAIDYDISLYQCVVPNKYNLTFYENHDNQNSNLLAFYFQECINSTLNNNSCYSREEINLYFQKTSVYFLYYFFSARVNHFDKDNPIKISFKARKEKISYDFYYRYYDYYKLLSYASDDGSVKEDFSITTSLAYDEKKSTFKIFSKDLGVSVPSFGSMQIQLNDVGMDSYRRFYPKLQSLFANIGGIINSIILVTEIIARYASTQMMFVEYSNYLVRFKPKKSEIKRDNVVTNEIGPSQMAIIICTQVKNMKTRREKIMKEKQELSLLDTFLPIRCTSKYSNKRQLHKCEMLIKMKLSIEHYLTQVREFDNLKAYLFDEHQLEIFYFLKKPYMNEYLSCLHKNRKNIETELSDLYQVNNPLAGSNRKISKIEVQKHIMSSNQEL